MILTGRTCAILIKITVNNEHCLFRLKTCVIYVVRSGSEKGLNVQEDQVMYMNWTLVQRARKLHEDSADVPRPNCIFSLLIV